MKSKILILLLPFYLFALEGYSPYKIYQANDTLTYQNLDSNIIRGSDWSDVIVDTLEKEFIRFSDIDDSSFTQMSVDTVDADTITAEEVTTDRLSADSATFPILKGHTIKRDSTTFTGGVRFTGNATASTFTGSLVGNSSTATELAHGSWYKDTVVNDSIYEGETLISHSTARVIKIGRIVTVSFEGLGGVLTGGTTLTIRGIPYNPERTIYIPVMILNNSSYAVGVLEYNVVTSFTVKTENRGSLSDGIGGLRPQTVVYTTN